jgi:hypothetical protein
VHPNVAPQIRTVSVLHVAEGASKWLLARMGAKMQLKAIGQVKRGRTHRTLDGFAFAFQFVLFHVAPPCWLRFECPATFVAFVLVVVAVRLEVTFEAHFGVELFVADVALDLVVHALGFGKVAGDVWERKSIKLPITLLTGPTYGTRTCFSAQTGHIPCTASCAGTVSGGVSACTAFCKWSNTSYTQTRSAF